MIIKLKYSYNKNADERFLISKKNTSLLTESEKKNININNYIISSFIKNINSKITSNKYSKKVFLNLEKFLKSFDDMDLEIDHFLNYFLISIKNQKYIDYSPIDTAGNMIINFYNKKDEMAYKIYCKKQNIFLSYSNIFFQIKFNIKFFYLFIYKDNKYIVLNINNLNHTNYINIHIISVDKYINSNINIIYINNNLEINDSYKYFNIEFIGNENSNYKINFIFLSNKENISINNKIIFKNNMDLIVNFYTFGDIALDLVKNIKIVKNNCNLNYIIKNFYLSEKPNKYKIIPKVQTSGVSNTYDHSISIDNIYEIFNSYIYTKGIKKYKFIRLYIRKIIYNLFENKKNFLYIRKNLFEFLNFFIINE